MTYLYIHGFGGSGKGIKASLFRSHFGDSLIAPSLSYVPDLAIDTLKQLVESLLSHTTVTLIGSSLGGYYAIFLAEHYGIKAVLINPSVEPYKTLKRVMGSAYNYYDESHFEWNEKHISMLKPYEPLKLTPHQYLVLLQSGDELLDYRQAQSKFENSTVVMEEGGSHSYDDIESKFEMIEHFAHSFNYL